MFLLVYGRHVGAHSDGHQYSGRLHTKLFRFGYIISMNIKHSKNCTDLNLVEDLLIYLLSFPSSGLYLLNDFDSNFWWPDSVLKPKPWSLPKINVSEKTKINYLITNWYLCKNDFLPLSQNYIIGAENS